MGLEVSYEVFVGNDASFLDTIHLGPDLNVDVAAWVRDGEEGVLKKRLVWNIPDIDTHVLDVGHRGV